MSFVLKMIISRLLYTLPISDPIISHSAHSEAACATCSSLRPPYLCLPAGNAGVKQSLPLSTSKTHVILSIMSSTESIKPLPDLKTAGVGHKAASLISLRFGWEVQRNHRMMRWSAMHIFYSNINPLGFRC